MAHDYGSVFDKEFHGESGFDIRSHTVTLWDNCDLINFFMDVIEGFGEFLITSLRLEIFERPSVH